MTLALAILSTALMGSSPDGGASPDPAQQAGSPPATRAVLGAEPEPNWRAGPILLIPISAGSDGVGASLERDVLPIGPARIAVGMEALLGECGDVCNLGNAYTNLNWSGVQITAMGRLTIRLPAGWRVPRYVTGFPISPYLTGLAGAAYAGIGAAAPDASVRFRGWGVAPAGGGALGLQVRVFTVMASIELRLLFGGGRYRFVDQAGSRVHTEQESDWTVGGLAFGDSIRFCW